MKFIVKTLKLLNLGQPDLLRASWASSWTFPTQSSLKSSLQILYDIWLLAWVHPEGCSWTSPVLCISQTPPSVPPSTIPPMIKFPANAMVHCTSVPHAMMYLQFITIEVLYNFNPISISFLYFFYLYFYNCFLLLIYRCQFYLSPILRRVFNAFS